MKRVLGSDSPKNQCEVSSQYESADQKAERNRERNREHAKKTRLRKKEMIEGMKIRLLELQRESARLEQLVEESNTASILLCLGGKQENSSSAASPMSSVSGSPVCLNRVPEDASSSKRRRKGSEQEECNSIGEFSLSEENKEPAAVSVSLMKGNIIDQLRQKVRVEASKNFNKDQYIFAASTSQMMEEVDEDDDSSVEPSNKLNSSSSSSTHSEEVENEVQNRRARNRMHAKLTRDRKKLFTNKMQETILLLESRNQQLRCQLDQLLKSSAAPPAPFHTGSFSMPTLYGAIPLEQKLQGTYDPLTAFCYFAEIWNQAFEAKKHPTSSKSVTSF